jgi:acyl carrier protein
MALAPEVIEYLNQTAQREGLAVPQAGDDLFATGILDSFSLVEFISVVEQAYAIKVPDADVNPGTFQTIEKIENYVAARQAESN